MDANVLEQEIKKYTDTIERLSAEIFEVEQRTKPIQERCEALTAETKEIRDLNEKIVIENEEQRQSISDYKEKLENAVDYRPLLDAEISRAKTEAFDELRAMTMPLRLREERKEIIRNADYSSVRVFMNSWKALDNANPPEEENYEIAPHPIQPGLKTYQPMDPNQY